MFDNTSVSPRHRDQMQTIAKARFQYELKHFAFSTCRTSVLRSVHIKEIVHQKIC